MSNLRDVRRVLNQIPSPTNQFGKFAIDFERLCLDVKDAFCKEHNVDGSTFYLCLDSIELGSESEKAFKELQTWLKGFVLSPIFYFGLEKVGTGEEVYIPYGEGRRSGAIEEARNLVPRIANSFSSQWSNSLFCLEYVFGRAPVWDWYLDNTSEGVEITIDQCQYSP